MMSTKRLGLILAATLAWLNPSAWGYDTRYSNIEERLTRIERKVNLTPAAGETKFASKPVATPVAFLSDENDRHCGDSCDDEGCCSCCESRKWNSSSCCSESHGC